MTVNKGTVRSLLLLLLAAFSESFSPPLGHSRDDVVQQVPAPTANDDRTLLLGQTSNSYSGYPYAQLAQKPYGYSAGSYQQYPQAQANSYAPAGGGYAAGGSYAPAGGYAPGGQYNSYGNTGYAAGSSYGYSGGILGSLFHKGIFSYIVPFVLIPLLFVIAYSIFFPFSVTLPSNWGRQGGGAMEQATFMIQRVLAAVEDDNCRQRQACEAGLYAKKLGLAKDTAIGYVEKFAPAKMTPYINVLKEAANSSDEALNYCDQFACPTDAYKSRTTPPTDTPSAIPPSVDIPSPSDKKRDQQGTENDLNKDGALMK